MPVLIFPKRLDFEQVSADSEMLILGQAPRTWVLEKQAAHKYTGKVEDVIDSADGTLFGNVLNWQYMLNLQVDDTTWKIKFDDWMFLVSEDLLLNKAIMTKFGFKVGEVTIVFQKNNGSSG